MVAAVALRAVGGPSGSSKASSASASSCASALAASGDGDEEVRAEYVCCGVVLAVDSGGGRGFFTTVTMSDVHRVSGVAPSTWVTYVVVSRRYAVTETNAGGVAHSVRTRSITRRGSTGAAEYSAPVPSVTHTNTYRGAHIPVHHNILTSSLHHFSSQLMLASCSAQG